MNIGIIPFDSDPAHVMHKWRYDILTRNLPEFGHTAEYWNENKKYDAVIIPITLRNERTFNSLCAAGIPLIGDSVDDVLSFPYSNYLLAGRVYYRLKFDIIESRFRRLGKMIEKCSRIVVGSSALQRKFTKLNKNSAIITDAITEDILSFRAGCEQEKPCRIAWFGNVASLHGFKAMGRTLDMLAEEGGYELVLITSDYTQGRYLGKQPRSAKDFIRGQRISCRLVNWDYTAFLTETAKCHIGIVPVDCDSPFIMAKPAGRALLMMGMGLPVVTGPVESHVEAIREGVTGFIARSPLDWVRAIRQLGASAELRKSVGLNAARYVKENFSEKIFTSRYLKIINSL
ncbi:MAG: glycosyltransferase [Elusimicrobia bacterium]|nr:glycosyltransferase [Elusimicrobiota bacterium]